MSELHKAASPAARPPRLPGVAMPVALALLYYLAARLGLLLAFESTNASPIWPPTGLAIAALYLLGYRYWPAITVGAFLANFAVFSANHVAVGLEAAVASSSIAIGNTLEALTGALLLRRLVRSDDLFGQTGNVFIFALSVAAASLISAVVGTESLMIGHLAPEEARTNIALSWWLGDLGGAIVVMPALVSWLRRGGRWWIGRSPLAMLATLIAVLALSVWIFGGHVGGHRADRLALALFFPIQAWTAYRFGRRGVTLASLILASAAVMGTVHRLGPFTAGPLNDSLILLVSFVSLVSITGLLFAADLREREQVLHQIEPFRSLLPSWATLLAALCLTVVAWHLMSADTERRAKEAFEDRANDLSKRISDRMDDYSGLLRGAAGLVGASESLNHQRWQAYIESLEVESSLPGVQAIGYMPVVPREGAGQLVERLHAEGFADFHIWPDTGSSPVTPVIYIEPFEGRNLRAFGYNQWAEPTRHQAMERARDSGQPILSARVTLVQENGRDPQAGALLYRALYSGDARTLEERRSHVTGYVYAAFRIGDLLESIVGRQLGPLALDAYDGTDTSPERLIYSSGGGAPGRGFEQVAPISVRNHTWTLRFRALPVFEEGIDRQKAQLVLVAGSVISLLLFTLIRALSVVSERALRIAEERATALRDSEATVTALAESARDAIVIVDADGRIVSWNPGATEIFGYSTAEAVGMALSALVPPALQQSLQQALELTGRDEGAEVFTRTLQVDGLTRAGQIVPLEVSLCSWRTSAGRLYGGILRDIGERERNTEFLRGMFNDAPDAILVANREGRIVHANRRCTTLFGYELDALLKLGVSDLVPDAFRPGHAAHVEKYFDNPQRRSMGTGLELAARRRNGTQFPVDITLTPLRLKGGNLAVATISDVTELRRNQEALRSSEERLRLLIDGVGDYAIFLLDPDGNIASWNAGAQRIKGYRAEEIIGHNFSRFYTDEDRARNHPRDVLEAAKVNGHYEEEGWRVRKDGSLFWASISVTALRERDGTLRGFSKVARDLTERRAAEDVIAGISRRLAIATGAAGIGVWELNLRTNDLVWDDQMYAMYDIDRRNAEGKYEMWRKTVMPEDLERTEKALTAMVENGAPFSPEFRITGRDGSIRYIKASAVVLTEPVRGDRIVTGVNWDITDLRNAELALRTSEERFRATLENAPIGMAIVSLEGHWLEVNRAICNIVGYSREELLKLTFQDITHPDDLDADIANVNELLRGEQLRYQMEKRYFHRDGHVVWIRLTVSLMRDSTDQPLYFITQIEDITEARSAREVLHTALALQEAILEAAGVCITAVTRDGVFTHFNRAAEQMLGYTAEEMIGRQTPAILHDPQEVIARAKVLSKELGRPLEPQLDAIVAKVRTGVVDEGRWTYIRKDGSRLPVQLSLSAIRDPAGEIIGYIGIAADITEREQKDRAIREALHEKETLLKEVYHRVKNNLQVITSLFNLQARTMPAGTARDALKQGAERVRAMALVHEKLYQSSTLSSISIAEYVSALCHDLSSASGVADRGIRVVTKVEDIQIGLETAVPLGLLMNELISNSFKHGFPEGRQGEVRIQLQRVDEAVGLLDISDTGIGYPEAALQGKSTSLGLKLIQTLSRQLDGTLQLENRDGAHATLRFNLAPARPVGE